jgi:PrtD family type I secretion system ABC transporter
VSAEPELQRPKGGGELAQALRTFWGAFIGIGIISAGTNILYLTGSFFMLEIYDRVLPSRSSPTLLGLVILAVGLYVFQGILEIIRGRILVRIAGALDEAVSSRIFGALTKMPLRGRNRGDGMQPLRDLDQIRSFLSGQGPAALADLPWLPFYLGICFLFHPLIGLTATIGGAVLVILTLLAEIWTREGVSTAAQLSSRRVAFGEASRRNAEVLQAMGMGATRARLWNGLNERYMAVQRRVADVAGGLSAASKVMRLLLQSLVLAVGAFLVLQQQATAGIIIASSILAARALAPVELAIANWRGFLSARQSHRRLNHLLEAIPADQDVMTLPRPESTLAVERVSASPPGSNLIVAHDVTFRLEAGQGLGIIGPSASGKSSLVRLLVGVWQPARGKVRIDGAAVEQWLPAELGRYIGYLPQDVELFDGTIAENISRFDERPDPSVIIAAARAAAVHDIILRLPEGYETRIGENGAVLSSGQRQRLALARALYNDPFLVVLDEPNSNLDADGEAALTQAIIGIRRRSGIVVVVAHRPSALAGVDQVLMMAEGRVQACGPKDEVLARVLRPATPVPFRVVQREL